MQVLLTYLNIILCVMFIGSVKIMLELNLLHANNTIKSYFFCEIPYEQIQFNLLDLPIDLKQESEL